MKDLIMAGESDAPDSEEGLTYHERGARRALRSIGMNPAILNAAKASEGSSAQELIKSIQYALKLTIELFRLPAEKRDKIIPVVFFLQDNAASNLERLEQLLKEETQRNSERWAVAIRTRRLPPDMQPPKEGSGRKK